MTANEIEQLATKFAEALKEFTPQAIDLAQQMFLLTALQNFLMLFPLVGALWFLYYLSGKVKVVDSHYGDITFIPISIAGMIISVFVLVCVGAVITNAANAMFPEAALLGKLIK